MNPISGSPPLSPPSLKPLDERQAAVRNRDDVDPQIRKAAEGMETMFMDYMMKTMRGTVEKNDLDLENSATEIYRGMLDTETVQRAVHQGGVGLADQIIAYLEARSYNKPKGPATEGAVQSRSPLKEIAKGSTGGTHEGEPIR